MLVEGRKPIAPPLRDRTKEAYTMGIFRLLFPSVSRLSPMTRHTCQKEFHPLIAAMKLEEKI
jgi:hypothetical protein